MLVALVAGYARRISGEADRQQSLALDRLGRLADANALLFSLHRVAQTLPASLDLDEVLDSTMGRLRDLFEFEAAAVLLYDETDRGWVTARREAARASRLDSTTNELPPALVLAIGEQRDDRRAEPARGGGPGLAPQHVLRHLRRAPRPRVGHRPRVDRAPGAGPLHRPRRRAAERLRRAGRARHRQRPLVRPPADGRRRGGAHPHRPRPARPHRPVARLPRVRARPHRQDRRQGRATSAASLEQLRSDVRDVIREVRDTLYDLRTDVSESQDMLTVLDLYLQRVRERTRARDRPAQRGHRAGCRSCRSASCSASRRRRSPTSRSTPARATSRSRGGATAATAVLEVADDGKGFPIGRAGRLDSYGIIGMRERAASIGATLDVESTPGSGTRVRCLLGVAPAPRASLVGLRRSNA